jgi:outer membrane protein TolC
LDQAKRNFEISEIGVKLSASRVEEQQILRELGQGTSRDLVQAQEDLVSAKNQRINALVSHKISRLTLWRAMGILFIHEGGQWEEKTVESELPQTVADQPEMETVSQDS